MFAPIRSFVISRTFCFADKQLVSRRREEFEQSVNLPLA